MISYKIDTELWARNHSDPNLNLYTLGPISPEIYGKFKDVISIFGSNETSGPTLLCKLSYYMEGNRKPFFKAQDDFYGYEIIDGRMHVKMPVYNTVHNTQDKFEIIDDKFYFKGRDDLYRINGLEVDKFHFEQLMYKILRSDDASDFDEIGYNFFNTDGSPDSTVNPASIADEFKEHQYTAGRRTDGTGEPLDEFIAFAIKIVMQGTNSAEPPKIKDLRAIALAT